MYRLALGGVGQVTREQWQTEANGLVESIAYEWSAPGAQRRMLFVLSVAPSATAEVQIYRTASIIRVWGSMFRAGRSMYCSGVGEFALARLGV